MVFFSGLPSLDSRKCCVTPPICIAIRLQFVLQCFRCPYALRKGKYCQYSSHLYCSTPDASHLYCNTLPIRIAVPLEKSWWLWSQGCSPSVLGQFSHGLFSHVLFLARLCLNKGMILIGIPDLRSGICVVCARLSEVQVLILSCWSKDLIDDHCLHDDHHR